MFDRPWGAAERAIGQVRGGVGRGRVGVGRIHRWVWRPVTTATDRARQPVETAYERHLRSDISSPPAHVAIIQDGNRRYARQQGEEVTNGHRKGAETTANVLEWCADIGVRELTLYAFSTENFDRPREEREALFDLLAEKFREFADADEVRDNGVCIRAVGDVERLPERVRDAVAYAERCTADHDTFLLNVALAYGGRHELLEAARGVARDVSEGELDPGAVDAAELERRLYERPERDVDLIIRTGGDERTSNFLPWHANGNEAAVFFCAPYWPEFSKTDFLRAVRTYEHREESWRRARADRALALLRSLGEVELAEARRVLARLRESLPGSVPSDVARASPEVGDENTISEDAGIDGERGPAD